MRIYTLGQFAVRRDDHELSFITGRSNRLWDLFKYLLTHRGKAVPPETILENLWPEQNYKDPKSAMRTPVYRLRQILSGSEEQKLITFSQGCYSWNPAANYQLDVEVFEYRLNKARMLVRESQRQAIHLYQQALPLYKGEYLPECNYQDWVLPVRNYYRRLYLQSVNELADLLWLEENHKEILTVCENAILLEPHEEDLHIHFLRALLKDAKYKEAHSHYKYVTALFYKDLGIKPSLAMRSLYRDLQDHTMEKSDSSPPIADRPSNGAFVTTPDMFHNLRLLESQRAERSEQAACVALLENKTYCNKAKIFKLIQNTLRKSDVICPWHNNQIMIMLGVQSKEQAHSILKRIVTICSQTEGVRLHYQFQPLVQKTYNKGYLQQ